jgi:hypothetical protein
MSVLFAEPGVWKNTDPRDEYSYGMSAIVIVRPTLTGQLSRTGVGDIETVHNWKILTSFEDYRIIDASDKWDSTWWWVLAPSGHVSKNELHLDNRGA